MPGMDPQELGEALHALAAEADREGPLGLKTEHANWPHIKLQPLVFDGLGIVDERVAGGGDAEVGHASAAPDLWLSLARAALASDGSKGGAAPSESEIARAIDENDTRDQAIIGHLLQIGQELRTASGQGAEELKRRTARLPGSLNPATLRRLVGMGGDPKQRGGILSGVTTQ